MTNLLGTAFGSTSRQELPVLEQNCDAVRGHQDTLLKARRRDAALRNLLLGSVAAGVAMFGYGRTAYAACVPAGATITCTGDLSNGVSFSNYNTHYVNSLTADIAPPPGTDGIEFTSNGPITIVSDTGEFEIITSGVFADGILADTNTASAVSVTHTGDITSMDRRGIYARSQGGSVTIVSTGEIQADDAGIYAYTSGAGAVSVTHTGDITSDNLGIDAYAVGGTVTTVSTGDIQADREGIRARSRGASAVSITHTGDIASTADRGIEAYSNSGTVTTVSTGDIQAANEGIFARASGSAAVSVTHTGDITSDINRGIEATANSGPVTTVSSGTIRAADEGIHATSSNAGAVSVTHDGDITSDTNQGIYARSGLGLVTTVSTGYILADREGIRAVTSGASAVSVTHTGDIASSSAQGINALSTAGTVTTVSTGNIQADREGIRAVTSGAGAVSVTHTGDVTSTFDRGIEAQSNTGTVITVSNGTIQADLEGIFARNSGAGAVSVTHTGDITSDTNRGIVAASGLGVTAGAITTVSVGTIQADLEGIYARTSGSAAVSVTHTGDITSDTNRGIYAFSNAGTVTTVSTGDIQANLQGIFAQAFRTAAVSITHTGDITSTNDRGIYAYSADGSVAITLGDGVVQGPTDAISATSETGTELTLNAGSVIIGKIIIGGNGAAVLNTGPGLSIAHTFTGTVPTIGDVSGNVAVVSGNQIAVADISGFAAADNQLSATLDGVSGVLAANQHSEAGNWWISGFGGMGVTSAVNNSAETTHKYGGLVAGTFALIDNGVQLGVFAGAANGVHTTDITNGLSGRSTSYFVGLNGRFVTDLFSLDFAVTAGGSSNEGKRIVANNTVATGLESASSSFDSFFIAPEITLSGAPITIQDFNFIPSLRVRYEAMQSGGFTETGIADGGIIAGGATSHAVNMRLQGAVPIDLNILGTTLMARGGVDTRFASFSGNDVTLMGVVTSEAGAGDEFSARGFFGLDFSHALSDYATLTANGELRGGTTGFSASASLGLKGKF